MGIFLQDDQLTAALEVEQAHLASGPSSTYFFSMTSHGMRRGSAAARHLWILGTHRSKKK
jgi:hypothetical protein